MRDVEQLEEMLSRPSDALIGDLKHVDGNIVVLGANGKMGPTLVRMALRAVEAAGTSTDVVAVSRFGAPGSADALSQLGATVVAADITNPSDLASLPEADNVVFLVGAKFGTTGNEHETWMTNTYLPGRVAERYRQSRIVALSTGNVYGLSPAGGSGPNEAAIPDPVGDYAMSCLGRERIFTYFCHNDETPLSLIRLNYAVDLRYGVLVDIASAIVSDTPVDLRMGYANVVWQRYANEVILRSILKADVPPFVLNLTGTEKISIRSVAEDMGEILGKTPQFEGAEQQTALLSDASRCEELFGPPDIGATELAEMVAEWVGSGGSLLGKPTHFESRDGQF